MADLTTWQLVLIGVLGAVQIGLMLAGLITVLRTPAGRLTAPRIVWALICFIQFIGPIVFFAAGRKPVTPPDAPPPGQASSVVDRVVAELYGAHKR